MFESDFCKTNEEIAVQSREILQTFVWWKEGWVGGGGQICPHHQTSVNFRKFAKLCLRWLKTYYFQIWHSLPMFKALVLEESTDFP